MIRDWLADGLAGRAPKTISTQREVLELLIGIIGAVPNSHPTAAMGANDLAALGLLQQCVRLGIRVPDELAIVGYDDIEFAGAAAVPSLLPGDYEYCRVRVPWEVGRWVRGRCPGVGASARRCREPVLSAFRPLG